MDQELSSIGFRLKGIVDQDLGNVGLNWECCSGRLSYSYSSRDNSV